MELRTRSHSTGANRQFHSRGGSELQKPECSGPPTTLVRTVSIGSNTRHSGRRSSHSRHAQRSSGCALSISINSSGDTPRSRSPSHRRTRHPPLASHRNRALSFSTVHANTRTSKQLLACAVDARHSIPDATSPPLVDNLSETSGLASHASNTQLRHARLQRQATWPTPTPAGRLSEHSLVTTQMVRRGSTLLVTCEKCQQVR